MCVVSQELVAAAVVAAGAVAGAETGVEPEVASEVASEVALEVVVVRSAGSSRVESPFAREPEPLAAVPEEASSLVPVLDRTCQVFAQLVGTSRALVAVLEASVVAYLSLNSSGTGALRWEFDAFRSGVPSRDSVVPSWMAAVPS